MSNHLFTTLSRLSALSGVVLVLSGVPSFGANKAEADAFPHFENYIKISGQAASVSGSTSAFQNRTRLPGDGGAGIEDLHLSRDLSKETTLVIDGKALVGSEDYLGKINLAKNEVGSVDMGYKRFRTFYDGVGGFFPLNKQWMPLKDSELATDRSKFWVEGTIALPNAPVMTIRYTNELRTGEKDSTIWGDSDFTGLPNNVSPISQVRKMAPSYIEMNERHELLEASVRHVVGKTTAQVTVFADQTDNTDKRYVTRFPGEVRPFPAPASTVLLPSNQMNNQVVIVETEAMQTKTLGAHVSADTVLNDQFTVRFNGAYDLIHTDIGGGRPLLTSTPTATGVVIVATDNYAGLNGGTRVKDYTGSVAVDYRPSKDLFVKLALRAQSEFIRGSSSYTVISASGTPAVTVASTPRTGWSKLHQNVRTPVLELRYTGVKDLALYFTGSKRDLSGDERNTSSYNPLTAANGTLASQNVSENHGNYTVGANWKQSSLLTLRGELYHKGHKDNTIGYGVRVGDYYLLDSEYRGYKVTASVKPSATISFNTRLVAQRGKMKVTGFLPDFPAYDSLDSKSYTISESIDWTPNKFWYVQLTGSKVYQVISTIYPRAGVTPATSTAIAFDSNKVLQNSDNNYDTATVLTGFAVDRDTDAQFQVTYYRANNDNSILAPLTMPYGVAVKDLSITVGVKHRFNKEWIGTAKVGYLESKNDTSGGNSDFHGPLAYLSIDHAL